MFKAKSIAAGSLQPSSKTMGGRKRISRRRKSRPKNLKSSGSAIKSYVEFGGTDEYIEFPAHEFDITNADFSISVWVNPPAGTSGSVVFLSKYVDGSNAWNFLVTYSGSNDVWSFNCETSNTSRDSYLAIATEMSRTNWNHIVLTADRSVGAGGMILYVNGTAVSSLIIANTSTTTDLSFLGTHAFTGRANTVYSLAGTKIADLRMYSKAMTAAEVTKLYDESFTKGENAAGLESDLMDWYSFGDRETDNINPGVTASTYTNIGKLTNYKGIHPDEGIRSLVDNETFATLDDWSTTTLSGGPDWTISGGKAICTQQLGKITLTNEESSPPKADIIPGFGYELIYTYTHNDTGSHAIAPYLGTIAYSVRTEEGTYTETLRSTTNTAFYIGCVAISSAQNELDNIQFKQIPLYGQPINMESSDFKQLKLKGGRLA